MKINIITNKNDDQISSKKDDPRNLQILEKRSELVFKGHLCRPRRYEGNCAREKRESGKINLESKVGNKYKENVRRRGAENTNSIKEAFCTYTQARPYTPHEKEPRLF